MPAAWVNPPRMISCCAAWIARVELATDWPWRQPPGGGGQRIILSGSALLLRMPSQISDALFGAFTGFLFRSFLAHA